ncbi:unnamed protein product [Lactuca saligna]|uniref:Uncharacterized protein n=1 Tax=Lactuca saligna TaxID=75948 RepID=A0AA36EFM0_LACSI|nr:unnamed protein product [Lactuca saligna]
MFERITKEHAENAAKMNKAMSNFAEVCKTTTKKVDKLISEATAFMETYRTTYNNNTASVNEALQQLGSMFKTEKYEPVMTRLQLMIKLYSHEVGLLDVDIVTVLRKKPSVVPKEAPKDYEKLKPRKI